MAPSKGPPLGTGPASTVKKRRSLDDRIDLQGLSIKSPAYDYVRFWLSRFERAAGGAPAKKSLLAVRQWDVNRRASRRIPLLLHIGRETWTSWRVQPAPRSIRGPGKPYESIVLPDDHTDLSDVEAVTGYGGAVRVPNQNIADHLENAMRSVLALGLLIALGPSANAAAGGHHAKSQHLTVHPSQAMIPSYATLGGVRIYRDDSVPGGLRTYHDDPPSYDDPSKFGGG
jgi:hypothetical protein